MTTTMSRERARTAAATTSRAARLAAHRARVARWRKSSAALWAIVLAGFACAAIAGGAALAEGNPAPNSVQAFGPATDLGADFGITLHEGVVGIVSNPTGGYWLVASDGGGFAFGRANFFGSLGGAQLNAPTVAMAATPKGRGYWLVGADGGVFAFGDATFEGSTAGQTLAAPIVSIIPTTSGEGYWLIGADGGVFAFGDARFHGSAGSLQLASPIASAAATTTGHGYWLLGADGGVFAFGDATFHGSELNPAHAAVGIAAAPTGLGYWVAYDDGSVRGFGVPLAGNGSTLDPKTPHPNTVAIAAGAHGGYWLAQGAVDPVSSYAADPFLACTRAHESDGAGGYQAVSAGGTYRGAYQFDTSTWNNAARMAGRDDLVGADPAATQPADQDLVAITLFHARGTQPWGGRCRGLA